MSRFVPIARVLLSDKEINAVIEVLKSGKLTQGEKTTEFEHAFADKVGVKFAVAVSSGTAALHISYLATLEPADEVLIPSFSHISTASMVVFSGCKPVFCDIDSRTFLLDLDDAERKITPRTKAIVPVHLFGNSCDIDAFGDFAKRHNLRIIWDAAQAHGTKYKDKDVGSFNDLVCYSFYPTKNITTGEGGAITCNDSDLYNKCKLLRAHWQTEKYYHPSLGFNYRMTNIGAAIGIEQLKKLDNFIEKRRENAVYLNEHLSRVEGVTIPFFKDNVKHSYHQYTILLDTDKLKMTRDEFANILKEKGIGTGIHYPRPIHKQPAFERICGSISLCTSEDLSGRVLSLPVHPLLTKEDLNNIVRVIEDVAS